MKMVPVAIIGPTASGKTDLGIRLAQKLSGAVLSADSRQIYCGMNIGTAKPRQAWRVNHHSHAGGNLEPVIIDRVPHHLFNIAEPTRQISLSEWQSHAKKVLNNLLAQNIQPVIAGGTMLYMDSVVYDFDLPAVAPNEAFRANLEVKSAGELYAELLKKDPDAKLFIEPGNKRRIIRALEVMAVTSKAFSGQRQRSQQPNAKIIGLFPGWEVLRQRISVRVQNMFTEGLLDETKLLVEKYGRDLPLLQTMNYKQALAVLDGKMSQEEATAEMIRVNMRYAHRQMSWWRRDKNIKWFTHSAEVLKTYF